MGYQKLMYREYVIKSIIDSFQDSQYNKSDRSTTNEKIKIPFYTIQSRNELLVFRLRGREKCRRE